MTDPERDLVATLMRVRARELYTAPVAVPKGLGRRVRRGQAFVVAVACGLVAAIAVGSFAVMTAIGGGGAKPAAHVPLGEAFTAGGVSIPVPEGWQARSDRTRLPLYVGERSGPVAAWPVVQLTNFALGSAGPFCPDYLSHGAAFPTDGVMLYVEQVFYHGSQPNVPRWPVGSSRPAAPASTAAVCRSGDPVYWSGGEERDPRGSGVMLRSLYRAFLVAGPAATAADEAIAVEAFRGTRFKPLDENSLPVVPLGPESTVMSGTFHRSRWRILAQKMSDGPCLHPEWDGGVWNANSETDGFQGECPLLFPLAGVGAGADLWLTPKGTTVQFIRGYAEARASRIVVELPDGTRLEASIGTVGGDLVKDYGLAPSFSGTSGQPFEVFVLPLQSPVRTAQVFAYDSSGRQIASDRFDCMSIGECA